MSDGRVHFLVVGGYAVIHYTEPRYTTDLDILVSRDRRNAEALYAALANFGAPLSQVTVDDFCTAGIFFQIGVAPNRVDIITSIPGVEFDAAYRRAEYVRIDNLDVTFISRQDLISAKLAAGRPQDLVDAGSLAKGNR